MTKSSNDKLRSDINKNFLIRIIDIKAGKTFLKSAGKYADIVGKEMKNKHFDKVLNGQQQNYTFKIRNRLIIDFRAK